MKLVGSGGLGGYFNVAYANDGWTGVGMQVHETGLFAENVASGAGINDHNVFEIRKEASIRFGGREGGDALGEFGVGWRMNGRK